MNITFLIGNGFDLNCGLDSSYSSVCEAYIASTSQSATIQKFKDHMSKDIETWGAFEERMARDMDSFDSEEAFLECLYDFIHYLDDWLQTQQHTFFQRMGQNAGNRENVVREMQNSIDGFYKVLSKNEENLVYAMKDQNQHTIYKAIVFNYTTVFDVLWEMTSSKSNANSQDGELFDCYDKPIHIHGYLENNMILGVDNLTQLPPSLQYPLSIRTSHSFVKPLLNDLYDTKRVKASEDAIQSSDIICVFGMSLGLTDVRWKNELTKWLLENENHQLFFYWHEYTVLYGLTLPERIAKMNDAKIAFLENVMQLDEETSDKLLKQIHVPCCSNIFNLNDVIEGPPTRPAELAIAPVFIKR